MAELILAVLCILVGAISGLGALFVLWANAIGGVTNSSAVNNSPSVFLGIFALAAVAAGASILVF